MSFIETVASEMKRGEWEGRRKGEQKKKDNESAHDVNAAGANAAHRLLGKNKKAATKKTKQV